MQINVGWVIVIALLMVAVLIEIYICRQNISLIESEPSKKQIEEKVLETSNSPSNLVKIFQHNYIPLEQIDMIFQKSPFGIIIYNDNGLVEGFNKAAGVIFGIANPGQDFGKVNFLNPDNITEEQKIELKKGKTFYKTIRYNFEKIRKNQVFDTTHRGERTLKVTIIPIIDETKLRKIQYVGFYEDITEMEECRFNRNELLKFTNTVFWNYDPETEVFVGGNDLKELMNLELSESGKAEATMADFINFIHPDDRKIMSRIVSKQLSEDGENDYYQQFRAIKNDKVIYVDSFTHQKIKDGKVLFRAGVIQDVSQQMIYRDAIKGISKNIVLKQGETYLKAMLREMAEVLHPKASGLFLKDTETGDIATKYVWNNNKKIWVTHAFPCHKEIESYLEKTFVRHNKRFDFVETEKLEGCLKDELNKKDILFIGIHTLQDSRKRTIGIVTIMFDNEVEKTIQLKQIFSMFASGIASEIERMQNLNQLEIALNSAKVASSAKSTFLSTISHEIRTPLNSIIGFTRLLEKENLSEKGRNYLQTVKHSSKALLNTIEDILDMTRIEAKHISLQYEPINIPDTMQEIFDIFYISLKEKNLKYIQDFPKDFPEVLIDIVRFRQVMMNIISNAIKFTHKGEISVHIRFSPPILTEEFINNPKCKPTNYLAMFVSVKDTGVGILKDDQKRIFEPFEQQKNQKQKEYGGTGLGLSISNSLIGLMGGSIQLKSSVGEGSTFTMYFPCLEKAYPAVNSSSSEYVYKSNGFELEEGLVNNSRDLTKGMSLLIIKQFSLAFGAPLRTLRSGLSITLAKTMADDMITFAGQNKLEALKEEAAQLKKAIYMIDLDQVDEVLHRLRSLL